jgi:glucose-1-phosphate thymidylyltransferase
MKCVLLVAGYATRLYPLTRSLPKPLLEVGGRPILDWILEKALKVELLDEIILVSNSRFLGAFEGYLEKRKLPLRASCLDDGTTDNEHRLGAIADLALAIERRGLEDDILVLAGDNLFDFELSDFAAFFAAKGADCITTHALDDLEALRRTGVIELGADGRVLSFEEKPREPRSRFAAPPFYLYRRETLPLLREYLATGGNPDAPGNFLPWLLARKPVYAYRFEGRRYDIGTIESYEEVRALFAQ